MSSTTHLNLDLAMFERRRPPRLLSLLARLDGFELDHELARGDDPRSGPLLATRAEQICRYKERKLFARRLEEVARGELRHDMGTSLRPSRGAVRAARSDLLALAEQLGRPGPANPQGVARARLLITDGSGPLYPPGRYRTLTVLVRRARDELEG